MRKYNINQQYFEVIDTAEKAYWLGFLAADGYLMRTKETAPCGVAVELQERDCCHLEKFREAIGSTHPVKRVFSKKIKKYQVRLRICSKYLAQTLMSWGFTYKKSYDLVYPNIDPRFDGAFILGYFDGDGSVWRERKTKKIRLSFTAGSMVILETVRAKLHQYCGANLATLHKVSKKSSRTYRIMYGGRKQVAAIGDWMYSSDLACLGRKEKRICE